MPEERVVDRRLHQVVEHIARAYARRGRMRTRIDIRHADLEPLLTQSVVHITE